MRDLPARRFVCARCRAPVLVCSHCDRGQIYCAAGCAAMARQQHQRAAAQRYQSSLRGRFKHAARTQTWRDRQALLAASAASSGAPALTQSVTHQGSLPPVSDVVLIVTSPLPAAAAAAPAATPPAQPCITIATTTTSRASTPAALPVWHCHWCHTPCAPHVRLGFLRHRRPRTARARGVPSHDPIP